jgi:hypothetical protein
MKLSKQNLRDKRDKVVFKALLRCIKESNSMAYLGKVHKSFSEIIRRCYDSRISHPAENFQANVFYWPEDSGCTFTAPFIKFIYSVLIINGINVKIKELGTRISELQSSMNSSPQNAFGNYKVDAFAFHDEMVNAFIKCGNNDDIAIERARNIELLAEAAKLNIPF